MAKDSTNDISLLCWNIGLSTPGSDSSKLMIDYLNRSNPDLCFLQEVRISQVKIATNPDGERSKNSLRLKLPKKYKIFYFQETSTGASTSSPCNCLIYNIDVLEVKEVEMSKPKDVPKRVYALDKTVHYHYYDDVGRHCTCGERTCKHIILDEWHDGYKDNKTINNRICAAIFRCKSIPCKPEIIVVCCHLPKKTKPEAASKFFEALDRLRKEMGHPVLVAGDFNCELLRHKVDCKGFEVPQYDPTIHKILVHSKITHDAPCIDYFAYKNFSSVKVKLSNVRAEVVWPSSDTPHLVSWKNGQPTYAQYHDGSKSILHKIHSISDHDPIKATLTVCVKVIPPTLNLIGYNMNNSSTSEMITNYLASFPNLCILQNKDSTTTVETNIPNILCITNCNSGSISSSIQFSIWMIQYQGIYAGAKFYAVSLHKEDEIPEKDFKDLFKVLNQLQDAAVVIAGDFSIYEVDSSITYPFIVQHSISTPTTHQLVYGKEINFLAYRNSTYETAANISLLNVHSEMIGSCPQDVTMTKKENVYVSLDLFNNRDDHVLTKIHRASPYDPLRAVLTIENTSPTFHVLYCNTERKNLKKNYFKNLNPKPDISIWPKICKADALRHAKLCNDQFGFISNDYFKGKIAYDTNKFTWAKKQSAITKEFSMLVFECRNVETFVIIIYHNPVMTLSVITESFQRVREKFKAYPVLFAGECSIDLFRNKRELKEHGIVIPDYDPTMYSMIKKYMTTKKEPIKLSFFAYGYGKSENLHIKLDDVHAEIINPLLNLMAGPDNVNYDILTSENIPVIDDTLKATMSFEATTSQKDEEQESDDPSLNDSITCTDDEDDENEALSDTN